MQKVNAPFWLNKKISLKNCSRMKSWLSELGLNTVCEQAACPNIEECFTQQQATFLILGKVCTRNCKFCNVKKGKPSGVDSDEPEKILAAIKRLNLKHVVITSVTRDDLADGGAGIFKKVSLKIRESLPKVKIELLIPDFREDPRAIEKIIEARPDIIGHNLETVSRLYRKVREGADYERSLRVLSLIKRLNRDIYTKSAILLGLGEKEEEVVASLEDLRKAGCDFLSLGQYLAPSQKHYPVREYITPQEFDKFRKIASALGFLHIESFAYARSSFHASAYLN